MRLAAVEVLGLLEVAALTLSRLIPHRTASRIVSRELKDILREASVAARGSVRTPNRPGTSREATTSLDDHDEMLDATTTCRRTAPRPT